MMARKKTNRIAKTMPGDVEIDKARKIVEHNSGLASPEGCRESLGRGQTDDWKGGGGGGAGGIGRLHGLENTLNDGYEGDELPIVKTGINVIYAGGGNGTDF